MNKKLSSTKTQQETNGMVGSWQWREAGGGEKLAAERSWRRREAGGGEKLAAERSWRRREAGGGEKLAASSLRPRVEKWQCSPWPHTPP